MDISEKITDLKKHHKKEMLDYSEQIRNYVKDYGNDNSDYLIHRINMSSYHRGAYNTLIELEK